MKILIYIFIIWIVKINLYRLIYMWILTCNKTDIYFRIYFIAIFICFMGKFSPLLIFLFLIYIFTWMAFHRQTPANANKPLSAVCLLFVYCGGLCVYCGGLFVYSGGLFVYCGRLFVYCGRLLSAVCLLLLAMFFGGRCWCELVDGRALHCLFSGTL